MTQHVIDYYQDGFAAIPFCKNCSAEGDALHDPCKPIRTEHQIMAAHMGLHPDMPETWPMDILNSLIFLKHREGEKRLIEEIRKLNKSP